MQPHPLGGPLPFAHYDRRQYETVSVEEGYAVWAAQYGDFEDRFDLDVFARSRVIVDGTPGARIVDLGCGNGRIGRWLAGRGAAALVGVDRSAEMLARAAERGVYERTLTADMAATELPEGSFDGAVTSMALCHVQDLGAFFGEARRILRSGGWLALLDYHPFFLFMGIPTHFDPPGGGSLAIENHIHPASRVFGAARAAGFAVREIEERFVDAAWVEAMPSYGRYLGWPITQFWAFVKEG
jgi:SAM-dependent methyltransferase